MFKESLPEKDYGEWAKKQVHLNDNLELEEDQAVRDFAESAVKQSMRAMQQQALLLNKSGISKMDSKT